jgi:hypothetical protein
MTSYFEHTRMYIYPSCCSIDLFVPNFLVVLNDGSISVCCIRKSSADEPQMRLKCKYFLLSCCLSCLIVTIRQLSANRKRNIIFFLLFVWQTKKNVKSRKFDNLVSQFVMNQLRIFNRWARFFFKKEKNQF